MNPPEGQPNHQAEPTDGAGDLQNAPPRAPLRPLPLPVRLLLLVLACVSLATGIAGIFIPGLPTTVFILIAAWAAARSSPRLYAWLLAHRLFGPMIVNWENGGAVSRRAKWSATIAMAACIAIIFFTASRVWVAELVTLIMLAVLLWLWRRPEPAPAPAPERI